MILALYLINSEYLILNFFLKKASIELQFLLIYKNKMKNIGDYFKFSFICQKFKFSFLLKKTEEIQTLF